MNRILTGAVSALLALAASAAYASDTARQLDSHEHGHATLNVAIDANQLLIEFESPAVNIVGFEHEPKNDEQKATLAKAKSLLEQGEQVFVLPKAADCTLSEVDVDAPHSEHADEKHSEEKHSDDKHSDEEHSEETHSEFHAVWTFSCVTIDKLDGINVRLFELFPGTSEIDTSIIGHTGQSATELTPQATQISL